MATSNAILQSYLLELLTTQQGLRFEDLHQHSRELLKRSREANTGDFLTPLSFYLGTLEDIEEVLIPYMKKKRQAQLRHDLKIAYLLLLTQKKYELTHQKTENVKFYNEKIKKCEALLDRLNPELQAAVKQSPELQHATEGNLPKYCGIRLAEEFVEQLVDLTDRKSKTLKEVLAALNEKRLYWVWGSSFLKTMIGLLPEDFYNSQQAADKIKAPDPYTGTLSWAMYYFRFSLNLFLLLKHTIKGPWMSKEEGETPAWERFKTQWGQRKFALLNDSLWGTANLLCFFWLNGKGILGTWGDALTLVLLVFDVCMTLWEFGEQQTQYEAQMLQFKVDIDKFKKTKQDLAITILDKGETQEQRNLKRYQLQLQINALKKARVKCERDWKLQKLSLYNNIGYAIGLTLAFIVLTLPFVSLPAATSMILGIAGAVICFAFTLINNAIRGGLEIYKSSHSFQGAKKEYLKDVDSLKDMLNKGLVSTEINKAKLLYLEIMKSKAETEYQYKMIVFQSVHLVRAIILESCVPAIIFSCLVFMPLGIGIAAMAGALTLAIATNVLINQFKPDEEKMKKIPPFAEEKYRNFCAALKNDTLPNKGGVFFENASLSDEDHRGFDNSPVYII